MKVSAIANSAACQPKHGVKSLKNQCPRTNLLNDDGQGDSVSFKSFKAKGAGVGALFGIGGLALISALSGGLAAPIMYGVYAAIGGTTGGMVGSVLDEAVEKEKENENNKKPE